MTLLRHGCSLPGSSIHGYFPGKNTGMSYHFLLQGDPIPGIEPESPALAGRFFTAEPPGKVMKIYMCICMLLIKLGGEFYGM